MVLTKNRQCDKLYCKPKKGVKLKNIKKLFRVFKSIEPYYLLFGWITIIWLRVTLIKGVLDLVVYLKRKKEKNYRPSGKLKISIWCLGMLKKLLSTFQPLDDYK